MIVLKGLNRITKVRPMNLFFIELIIVLLFFSLSGTVVLGLFAAADKTALKSSLSERAVMCVQSLSEIYATNGDMKKTTDEYFSGASYFMESDDRCMICLDEEFRPLYTEDAREQFGRISIFMEENTEKTAHGTYSELSVQLFLMIDEPDEIYSHTCSAYIPDFSEVQNEKL